MTFTYCGKAPEDFGCFYIPDEDQISDIMSKYEQISEDYDSRDGGYYFSHRVPPKEFELPCYYEDIDKKTMDQIVRWLDRRTSGRLVFDDRPDVYYDVVPSAKIEFEDYIYTRHEKTLHAGKFTVYFVAYDPFGKLTRKFLIDGEKIDYSTNLIFEDKMPPDPTLTDTSFQIYNPGTERTGLILRIAGDAPNGQLIKNTTNGQELALLPFNQSITTTMGKWFEIDSNKGQVFLVGGSTRELAFEYHDRGYIALEANFRANEDKVVSFEQGKNVLAAADASNGFSKEDVGKYIYTGDGWHKILSVGDVSTTDTDITSVEEEQNEENNLYASVTGSFAQSQDKFDAILSDMNEISIIGENVILTKLDIDYIPKVR